MEVTARVVRVESPDLPRLRGTPELLDALIRTVLGQQNTDEAARRQYSALQAAYPRWEAALIDGPDGIEVILKGAGGGLSRVKAAYLHGLLTALHERRGHLNLQHLRHEPTEAVRAELEALPGVGRHTANLLLTFELGRPAIPVEGNIERIVKRLQWVPERWSNHRVERWLDQILPRDWATRATFHVAMVRHGRHTCYARSPRCDTCVLRDLCPSAALLGPG